MMKPEIHLDNLDKNSGWLTRRYEIEIEADPEKVWEYAYNPETWTASNPDEHLGLIFYNEQNRPVTGVAFYQKEKVSGVYADLHGHILYAEKPKICVWTGLAEYKLFGIVPLLVPENGVIKIEQQQNRSLLSHTVYIRLPNTIIGKIFLKLSEVFSSKKGFVPHTYKELEYFKANLEK
jgi:hypothetical protein